MKVLAADSSKLDGYNASFALIDEYHESPTSKVKDVIYNSMLTRQKAHLCCITTAGFNKSYPCYSMRTMCCELLNNLIQDDTIFAAIYSMDESDDWKCKENWIKCTPNMGVNVDEEVIENRVKLAINNPSEEVEVDRKSVV